MAAEQPPRPRSVSRGLIYLAVVAAASGIGIVLVMWIAGQSGVAGRSSCTAGEQAAFSAFRQADGRFHSPFWDYEEHVCATEFALSGGGPQAGRYYRRQLLAHGWMITTPLHRDGPGHWGLVARRGDTRYEVRIWGRGAGVYVHQETPLYPFST